METVTRFAERQAGSVSAVSTPGPEVARTLSVTASYLLSEDGSKASLLAGGDGHAVQQIALQVPANRLHLVSVDKQGVARLKLRPRFEIDGERASSASTPRRCTTRRRRSRNSIGPPRRTTSWRAPTTPSASLSDRNAAMMTEQAARASPKLSSRTRDNAPSRIHRRRRSAATSSPTAVACCSTLRQTRGSRRTFRRRRTGASGLTCGQRKSAIVRIEPRSSRCTKRRSGSSRNGLLPTAPRNRRSVRRLACSRWTRRLKASPTRRSRSMVGLPLYTRDGAERLQKFLRESSGLVDTVVGPSDVTVRSSHAAKATAAQWAIVQDVQAACRTPTSFCASTCCR